MNFLIINHYAGCTKYGVEYRHADIARELLLKGHQVTIVASSFSHLREEPKVKKEKIEGINFIWIKTPKYKDFGLKRLVNMVMFMFKVLFIKLDETPTHILVSSPSPFVLINGLFFKWKYKTSKLIYEIRDIWPLSIIELKKISAKNPLMILLNYLDSLGIENADYILSPLSNIKEYILEKGYDKKIFILPNGISEIENKVAKSEEKLATNKFIVGYGGSLGDSNSIMNLIDAAVLLKDNKTIEFHIIGSGEREEDIRDIINKEKLTNIKLFGRVQKNKLLDLLSECDCLYKGNPKKNLYKYGISSIKIVEYLLMKKPVIDASCGVDIIKKSQSGICVKEENSEELMKGILKLKNTTKEDLKLMSENGYKFVIENYYYKETVKNFIDFLN